VPAPIAVASPPDTQADEPVEAADDATGDERTDVGLAATGPADTDLPGIDAPETDPLGADPTGTDLRGTDATQTDATQTDATQTDATQTDATQTDATQTDRTGLGDADSAGRSDDDVAADAARGVDGTPGARPGTGRDDGGRRAALAGVVDPVADVLEPEPLSGSSRAVGSRR
jgi:hypothetical protein